MYRKLFKQYENIENLAGKAWQHAINIELIEKENFKDCSLHCFHYQQMFEMFIKYLLETKPKVIIPYMFDTKLNKLENIIVANLRSGLGKDIEILSEPSGFNLIGVGKKK